MSIGQLLLLIYDGTLDEWAYEEVLFWKDVKVLQKL